MKFNREQAEAHEMKILNDLEEFKNTLDPKKQEAMTKLREAIKLNEEVGIPLLVAAQYDRVGFHIWYSFTTPENPDKYGDNYIKDAWPTIGVLVRTIVGFLASFYAVRIKVWSLIANCMLIDTDPPKDEMDDK